MLSFFVESEQKLSLSKIWLDSRIYIVMLFSKNRANVFIHLLKPFNIGILWIDTSSASKKRTLSFADNVLSVFFYCLSVRLINPARRSFHKRLIQGNRQFLLMWIV